MKIYTCALMPFEANDAFFSRDSGLLSRSLQAIGVESRVVMPALETKDPFDVIRATPTEFIDVAWWQRLDIEGVVFITWGFKEHTSVIQAARDAGILTCAIIETCGNPFPYAEILDTIRTYWRKGKFINNFPKRAIGTAARSFLSAYRGATDQYHRAVQIAVPHYALFNTPSGMERCLGLNKWFPNINRRSKALLFGYPIPDTFQPLESKERKANVIAIARWDALRHKRPHVLKKVIDLSLEMHSSVTFEIFGRLTDDLIRWHDQLLPNNRDRVQLRGVQPSKEIAKSIGRSQVLYCPSAMDGIPLAVIEGLCGGCSVVGLKTKDVAGLYWAVQEGDGSFAMNDSISSHASAVINEIRQWEDLRRNPRDISTRWKKWFSARQFSERIVELMQKSILP